MTDIRNRATRYRVNDIELAVEVRGEGPAILFIHGYPLSRAIWRHQVDSLSGWRRIAPDLRGMGESGAPAGGYGMAGYADDLRELLDELGIDRVVLCGLSMGGYIAFECLRRWGARVRGLVLMDTRAEADNEDGRRARRTAVARAREAGSAAIAEDMLPRMLSPGTVSDRAEMVEWVRTLMAATPVEGIVGALESMRERPDSSSLLGSIRVPTLVLAGEDDTITPPDQARAMAAAIPGARLVLIPRAGHLPPVEQPEVTTTALREFLGSLG